MMEDGFIWLICLELLGGRSEETLDDGRLGGKKRQPGRLALAR